MDLGDDGNIQFDILGITLSKKSKNNH